MVAEHRRRAAFEPAARLLAPTAYDPDMRRPASTVAGAVLVLLRASAGFVWLAAVWASLPQLAQDADVIADMGLSLAELRGPLLVLTAAIGAAYLVDLVLAVFILRGRNWPRIVVMIMSVVSTTSYFLGWWAGDQEIHLRGTLPVIALDILVLLALSSRSAAAYARRRERRPADPATLGGSRTTPG